MRRSSVFPARSILTQQRGRHERVAGYGSISNWAPRHPPTCRTNPARWPRRGRGPAPARPRRARQRRSEAQESQIRKAQRTSGITEYLARLSAPGGFAARMRASAEDLEVVGVGKIRFAVPEAVAGLAPFGRREQTLHDASVGDTWKIATCRPRISSRRWCRGRSESAEIRLLRAVASGRVSSLCSADALGPSGALRSPSASLRPLPVPGWSSRGPGPSKRGRSGGYTAGFHRGCGSTTNPRSSLARVAFPLALPPQNGERSHPFSAFS
jgi:hypothetical protein